MNNPVFIPIFDKGFFSPLHVLGMENEMVKSKESPMESYFQLILDHFALSSTVVS